MIYIEGLDNTLEILDFVYKFRKTLEIIDFLNKS
jgi:hypothetical protein